MTRFEAQNENKHNSPDKIGRLQLLSLRIAENQEQGKDERRIFCPGLLKTNFPFSFLIFLFLILIFLGFSIFLDFSFSIFWIFLFLFFFWIFSFFYFFGFSFFLSPHEDTYLIGLRSTSCQKWVSSFSIWAYLQMPILFIFYLDLPLTASSFHFFIWAYLQRPILFIFYLGLPLTASSLHFHLGLPLTASSLHFHIWAYL